MKHGIYFISGIDTDIGKTIATGKIAQQLAAQGKRVITQKLVQTGCQDWADDILTHRAIMNIPLQAADQSRLTMPQIYAYPASPHLAARLEDKPLNIQAITQSSLQLRQQYDIVLIEGAGGLAVPLTEDLLTIDYIKQNQYPVMLVTSGRLGSINHTLLSLMALQQHEIELSALIYNHIHDSLDPIISADTPHYLRQRMSEYFPNAQFWQIDALSDNERQSMEQRKQALRAIISSSAYSF